MQNVSNLRVAGHARALVASVYRATQSFPATERYGLTSQMRRAAISVCSNIAEGCGREGDRALASFLHIALGSASELEIQLLLATDLEFLATERAELLHAEVERVKRMLAGLIKALREAQRNHDART